MLKKSVFIIGIIAFVFTAGIYAQLTTPRASQRAAVSQTVGDTEISIVYHRPNVKERAVWGGLVPYGEVWRTGANEATVFEISRDVMINGQKLPKGKYSLHTLPTIDGWTIIFNKTWDQWGSFNYKADQDALRVNVKAVAGEFRETMTIDFDNIMDTTADVVIAWEKLRVPFKIDIGDANKRFLDSARRLMVSNAETSARFVLDSKMTANYAEAVSWLNASLAITERYNSLFLKARLLNELGKKAEAKTVAEKALQVGKASTPAANVAGVEALLKELK
jgi:Protein of unknown function (DUF2911)